jgi:hypothetical protein
MLLCMIWLLIFGGLAVLYLCAYPLLRTAVREGVKVLVVVVAFTLAALAGLLHQVERSAQQHRADRQAQEARRLQETQRLDRLSQTARSELERSLGR